MYYDNTLHISEAIFWSIVSNIRWFCFSNILFSFCSYFGFIGHLEAEVKLNTNYEPYSAYSN